MNSLQDKVAVITGGTRGIGLAIARGLAAEGAAVVVASRSAGSVEAAVASLRNQGFRAAGKPVDVADLAQVEALLGLALQEFGRVDIWVNNAGTAGPYGPTVEFTPEEFMRVIQTNIVGEYNGSRTAMRYFLKQGSGKLINMLGRGYNGPVANQNAYASSKAWGRSFTMALAEETRGRGVGVFMYNPGMVLTDLLTEVDVIRGSEEKLKNFERVLRILAISPEEAAQGVVRLASPQTDGKTGIFLNHFSIFRALGRAIEEGLRSLLKQPVEHLDIQLKTIPPAEQ